MAHNYSIKLENLKRRRFDEALKEHVFSESFHTSNYPDSVKYVLESIVEIDIAYAYKVFAISKKIHDKLAKALKKKGYYADYRYQGELKSYSNIFLYGDVELMVIKKDVVAKPHIDIQQMTSELLHIFRNDPNFKSVDYSDKTRIRITATKPTCEINILPTVWVDSIEYKKTKNEIYRGIAEFDFKNKRIKKYLPFLNIARVNSRNTHTRGNFNCLSRLLKTLRADSGGSIDLADNEINAILYAFEEKMLKTEHKYFLSRLPRLEKLLEVVYTNTSVFQELKSTSGKEKVFKGQPKKQEEIGKLKNALSKLIQDLKEDLDEKGLRIESPLDYNKYLG